MAASELGGISNKKPVVGDEDAVAPAVPDNMPVLAAFELGISSKKPVVEGDEGAVQDETVGGVELKSSHERSVPTDKALMAEYISDTTSTYYTMDLRVCLCVCVYVCMYFCVFVCVCVWEREQGLGG